MTFKDFLKKTNLDKTLLIGYYGGGNYGDELLLEVLQNLLAQHGAKDLTIAYQRPAEFTQLHKEFGNKRVLMYDKISVFKALMKNKNVIIGGGGLWGLDMNFNTFLMSVFLFIARLLGKKVYLLGVGYYSSTNRLGHAGAWLAAKAATLILARDEESFDNFSKHSKNVHLDHDLSWAIDDIDMQKYSAELKEFEEKITVSDKTLFIGLRHFGRHKNNFAQLIEEALAKNAGKPIIVALLENKNVDTESFAHMQRWRKKYTNIQFLDFAHNPLALFAFYQKYSKQLVTIAPQFHIIITAYLAKSPFLPVVYDNKVSEMLRRAGVGKDQQLPIKELTQNQIQAFIDNHYKGA